MHFANPQWIIVSPKTITLAAGAAGQVNATMRIPVNARPGEYQALVVFQPVAPGASADTPNIQVGTKVVFRIAQSNLFVGVYWRIRSLFEIFTPWSYMVLALLVLVPLAWFLARRFRISLSVSRKP